MIYVKLWLCLDDGFDSGEEGQGERGTQAKGLIGVVRQLGMVQIHRTIPPVGLHLVQPIASSCHLVSYHSSILNELEVLAGINPLALQPERLGIKWVACVR